MQQPASTAALTTSRPFLTGSAAYAFSTEARYHCLSALLCARHFSPALSGAWRSWGGRG